MKLLSNPEWDVLERLQNISGRLLPERFAQHARTGLELADMILRGTDDRSVSLRTMFFVFAIRVVSAVIAYFSQVLLARWVAEFEYGIFVAVWVGVSVLGGLTCLGVQVSIVRFISEYQTRKELSLLRGTIWWSILFCLGTSTVVALIGAGLVYLFAESITSYYVIPIVLALTCLPMIALQEVQDGIARAFNLPGTAIAPTFIMRPLVLLGVVAIFYLIGLKPDAVSTLVAAIFATWSASVYQFIRLMRHLRATVPQGPKHFQAVNWLWISLPILLVEGFYGLLTNTDILFVSYYLPPDQVGVYFASVKTLALAHFVYFAVRAGSAHRFAAYRAAGDRERYERFIQETVQWTFWPSLAFAVTMVLLGKYFLMLFGEAFVEGTSLLWILALGVIIRSSVGAAESVLTMSGEQKNCAIIYGLTFYVNFVLNWALIPAYGLKGAATATTLALAFESAALYAAAKRRLDLHIFIIPSRKRLSPEVAQ
ncbi:MAG: lipopolysaccharide biosynthesis protein [Rhizobiaceae bacterium]